MLESVGNPVAVNPDKELRKVAMERGWKTEAFRKPVTLRSRLPQLRRPEMNRQNTLAGLAGLGMLAAAAWRLSRGPRVRRWG